MPDSLAIALLGLMVAVEGGWLWRQQLKLWELRTELTELREERRARG